MRQASDTSDALISLTCDLDKVCVLASQVQYSPASARGVYEDDLNGTEHCVDPSDP